MSFGNAALCWELDTKKEGNWSGRSRVRRVLLVCIQLLLLQFLHVIWSMPTYFALFKIGYIWGLFKSLPCFQCYLQGIVIDTWSRDCQVYSDFLNNAKFVGMDQITCKNYNKSSWIQVNKILLTRDRLEQFPLIFVRSFQWNQTSMRWSRVSKAHHFLKILAT